MCASAARCRLARDSGRPPRSRRVRRRPFVDGDGPGSLAAAGVLLSKKRSGLGVDGGAVVVVAGRQQAVAALCLHHVARLDVCNRAPSSCLCHVAVRDRFAGLSSSVLCWSGFERSDTVRKLLGMIICVLVTPSNTSLVPTAITGPRAPTQGARSAAHFLGLV